MRTNKVKKCTGKWRRCEFTIRLNWNDDVLVDKIVVIGGVAVAVSAAVCSQNSIEKSAAEKSAIEKSMANN